MKNGYANGSDMLVNIDGKNTGHCTENKIDFSTETKERAVKPLASVAMGASMYKEISVTGLSIKISFSGLRFYGETESGFSAIAVKWSEGAVVKVKCYDRQETGAAPAAIDPWLSGDFVVTSLSISAPAGDDVTYSGELTLTGVPEIFAPEKTTVVNGN